MKNFGKSSRGGTHGLWKNFQGTHTWGASRVFFAIAQLSCIDDKLSERMMALLPGRSAWFGFWGNQSW